MRYQQYREIASPKPKTTLPAQALTLLQSPHIVHIPHPKCLWYSEMLLFSLLKGKSDIHRVAVPMNIVDADEDER